jgi:hypothetical protein
VVVFLGFDPAVRVVGANLAALAQYASVLAVVATIVAFVFTARRFVWPHTAQLMVLAIAWASAVPLLYVVAQHMVDAWQLCFLSMALFLWTGSARQQRFAGVPLAFAALTKLLPALVLLYVLVRAWRVGALGLLTGLVLLGIGQLLYGTLMGFGYPLAMLAGGGDTVARWSTHFENNSIRGILFKLGAGFHLQGDSTAYALDPSLFAVLSWLAYAVVAALVVYLLYTAWRNRAQDSAGKRAIELSLAVFTMLLVSPHTAQDYLVTALPVFAVWLHWQRWTVGNVALAAASALLIGVFVPMNLAARVIPFAWLLGVTGNAHNALFVDQIGSAIGAYEFFGFPALGLLLGWIVLARMERTSSA